MVATCIKCQLNPCACEYMEKLTSGRISLAITVVAKAQVVLPLPHRGGCPCPKCYSSNLKTFRGAS